MKTNKILDWGLAIVSALIMLQTLFFKFTGAEESIYIFESVGLEPIGRIGSGIVELLASLLLLIPATRAWGALVGLGTISGAIFFHLTVLGIEVKGDGGLLFGLAIAVFLSCLYLVWTRRDSLPVLKNIHL